IRSSCEMSINPRVLADATRHTDNRPLFLNFRSYIPAPAPMPLLVVGSVAIDNVETPQARRDGLLGGSATHFSCAASFFTDVQLVGVVGEDWPPEHTELLASRGVDTSGLKTVKGGKTFTWTGRYEPNM